MCSEAGLCEKLQVSHFASGMGWRVRGQQHKLCLVVIGTPSIFSLSDAEAGLQMRPCPGASWCRLLAALK